MALCESSHHNYAWSESMLHSVAATNALSTSRGPFQKVGGKHRRNDGSQTRPHGSALETFHGRNGQQAQLGRTGAPTGAANPLEKQSGVDCVGCDGQEPTLSNAPDREVIDL